MNQLRISLIQTDIHWENKEKNLQEQETAIRSLADTTDIIVLPEMFSTGFSMNSHDLAEDNNDITLSTVRSWASTYQVAICGSFIATENGEYYNRGFFITPEQNNYYYDKRHLFRMGNESKYFSPGNKKRIIPYKGWNICLMICYDLRFPVWSRNTDNQYDLLIYVANWPVSRSYAWKSLLIARAIENTSYVCGVNRIGIDGTNFKYSGDSIILDMKGMPIISAQSGEKELITATISLEQLREFREKFPLWKDADHFEIID